MSDGQHGAHGGEQRPLRVVMVSKALVVGAYQRKCEEIARLGVDLTVFTPPAWRDSRGVQPAEALHTQGYTLRTLPARLVGNFHLHYYPTLARELRRLRPDVLHMDEEPYNYATWRGLRAARRLGIGATFFTWQNLRRAYPFPFRAFERACYAMAPIALAGNRDAAEVLRAKGYRGAIEVFPQFGVDPDIFRPLPSGYDGPLRIGYVGGLLPEKGADLLLLACAGLPGGWTIELVGEGSERAELEALAGSLGIRERVRFTGKLSSAEMPGVYRRLDVLVLPSRTLPNWKEQFGRVLIEAMASGVPVIGSDSGEIPHVIGDAGLVFPEDDTAALRAHLASLQQSPETRAQYVEAGRQRVLERFTMQEIAARTVAVYARLAGRADPPAP
jgi:glycosyltransferase involved in cell wall biosynthesis